MKSAVAPGGLFLLEGYRPEQVDYRTGGPPRREQRNVRAHRPGCEEAAGLPKDLRRSLCLSTGRYWRDITRHAALPGIDPLAAFEAGQTARDDLPRSCQPGKALAHRCKRDAHLFGNLQIEPLTVFLQALQDFDHAYTLGKRVIV